jgi:ElaA protein
MDCIWRLSAWEELSTSELYQCIQLRIKVFVIEQKCPYQDADDKDQHSLHLMGFANDGRLVAYLRIVEPGISYDEWSIGRVVTDPEIRQSGLGKDLMKRALTFLKTEKNNPPVRISAQLYLRRFYASFGFVEIGEPYPEDDIPHIEMLYTPK